MVIHVTMVHSLTAFVSLVDAHESALMVSRSEDCSSNAWKDEIGVERKKHLICVWNTKFLQNGEHFENWSCWKHSWHIT